MSKTLIVQVESLPAMASVEGVDLEAVLTHCPFSHVILQVPQSSVPAIYFMLAALWLSGARGSTDTDWLAEAVTKSYRTLKTTLFT
jgi:hypothetical protein